MRNFLNDTNRGKTTLLSKSLQSETDTGVSILYWLNLRFESVWPKSQVLEWICNTIWQKGLNAHKIFIPSSTIHSVLKSLPLFMSFGFSHLTNVSLISYNNLLTLTHFKSFNVLWFHCSILLYNFLCRVLVVVSSTLCYPLFYRLWPAFEY